MRRLLARLRRLYADYRALRWALWALGAVASVGGTIVGALAADAWRRMGPVLTDSPEYASDAKASPPLASIHWSPPHIDLGPFVPLLNAAQSFWDGKTVSYHEGVNFSTPQN